jgi:SAM-dependent methyltransferase
MDDLGAPHVKLSSDGYLLHRSLTVGLRSAVNDLPAEQPLRCVDAGCGQRLWESLLRNRRSHFTGVDLDTTAAADVFGSADRLPFSDSAFDPAVCTQVFEHLQDHQGTAAEIARVLHPEGTALASIHEVWPRHYIPHNYGRWPEEGFEALFSPHFSSVPVLKCGKAGLCAATMCALLVNLAICALTRALQWPARSAVPMVNWLGWTFDRWAFARDRCGTFQSVWVVNYAVIARHLKRIRVEI